MCSSSAFVCPSKTSYLPSVMMRCRRNKLLSTSTPPSIGYQQQRISSYLGATKAGIVPIFYSIYVCATICHLHASSVTSEAGHGIMPRRQPGTQAAFVPQRVVYVGRASQNVGHSAAALFTSSEKAARRIDWSRELLGMTPRILHPKQ